MSKTNKARVPAVFMRYRESHHAIARYFAAGWTISKISHETGWPRRRLHIIAVDPTFQDLVAFYGKEFESQLGDQEEEKTRLRESNELIALRMINDKLADALDADEFLPMRELLAIAKSNEVKHTHDVNFNFAGKLDAAINRSLKVIEGRPVSHPTIPDPQDGPRLIEQQVVSGDSGIVTEPSAAPVEVVRGTQLPRPSIGRRQVA